MTQTAPAASPTHTPPPETIKVTSHRVFCDGGNGALGHPRVFLEIGEAHEVTCGYCDRLFVLDEGGKHGH